MKIKHNASHEARSAKEGTSKKTTWPKNAKQKKSFKEALASHEKPSHLESRVEDPLSCATKDGRAGLASRSESSTLLGRLDERAQQGEADTTAHKQMRDASASLFDGARVERSLDKRAEQKLDGVQVDTSLLQQDVRTEHQVTQAEHVQGTDRADMQALVDKIVKACHVGKGERNKRVLLMTVEVPGQGEVHVKIERQRQGTAIRFRARDPALTQRLRAHAPRLQESLRAKGVGVTRLTVSA